MWVAEAEVLGPLPLISPEHSLEASWQVEQPELVPVWMLVCQMATLPAVLQCHLQYNQYSDLDSLTLEFTNVFLLAVDIIIKKYFDVIFPFIFQMKKLFQRRR